MKAKIKGCYPAIITPFKEEGPRDDCPINYDSLDKLLEYVIEGGVDGVVVAGCTGSASVLSHDEQVDLAEYVYDIYGDRITVIAGDGSNSTREAKELALRMEDVGVFTHLSISPYYNKPSDRGLLEHYLSIADSIEGEMILYSVPGRTGGKGILPKVASKLAEHPNIIGIKEASGNMELIKETIERTKDEDFFVISGDDFLTHEIIKYGGVGVISVAANVAPRQVCELVNYTLNKDYALAMKSNEGLPELYSALFPKCNDANPSPNPVMTHYALKKIGILVGVPRLPLTEGEAEEKKNMDKVLKDLKLIL